MGFEIHWLVGHGQYKTAYRKHIVGGTVQLVLLPANRLRFDNPFDDLGFLYQEGTKNSRDNLVVE